MEVLTSGDLAVRVTIAVAEAGGGYHGIEWLAWGLLGFKRWLFPSLAFSSFLLEFGGCLRVAGEDGLGRGV